MLAQLRRKGRDRIQDRHHHPLLARSDLPAEKSRSGQSHSVGAPIRREQTLSHPKSFTVCRAQHSLCVLSSTVVLRTLCYANAFLDIDPTRRRRHASRRSVRDAESLVRTAEPRAGVTAESVVHAFRSAFAARENIAGANDIVLGTPRARRTLDGSYSSFITEIFDKWSPNRRRTFSVTATIASELARH